MKAAFNLLISIHSRPMVLSRRGSALTVDVQAAPSNYSRNMEVVNKVITKGREFIISEDLLSTYGIPKRGDALQDATFGTMIVTEVIEVYGVGAEILGYRLRVD
ncbi:hypothetical protein EKK58_10490 [Candidatus Dependentiae bacterium]|nr:MAG: hypothetical protein EKK58_10490 [Candidatus Dependentiae bacterium]